MVSTRLVDFPEDIEDETEVELPRMMFADGEEPVGVRVLTYQSSRSISNIVNALNEDEILYLRASPFGKLLEIGEKPAFSGRFARYLMSRQLKVTKKHEAWFRFAGHPIRFSLREFAIVTGLNCGELPKKPQLKKKKNINEKPYWPQLFGSMEDLRVSRALKMLRKKTVTDPEIRIKLACLAIVSSVLLSTNINMKMLKEYAELLVDIEDFMSYPWGRLAFDMLMTSIKNRDEIALSQNTIALKGFALALQLVIAEAVPSLTEVVQDACSSSESESEDEETENHVSKARRKTLNPAHAREVDRKAEVVVSSIIPQDPQRPLDESVLIWADEVFDKEVDNLVKLISQKFVFTKDMFKGGATSSDVQKMREALKIGRTNKQKRQLETESVGSADDKLASVVQALLQPEIKRIDGNVSAGIASMKELASTSLDYKDSVLASVFEMIKDMKSEILGSLAGGYAHVASHGHHNSVSAGNVSKTGFTKQPEQLGDPNNGEVGFEGHHISPSTANVSIAGSSKHPDGGGDDENANTIDNVLENLSHYSTPPGSPQICPVSNALREDENSSMAARATGGVDCDQGMDPISEHDTSTNPRGVPVPPPNNQRSSGFRQYCPSGEPSFSLGLTQENAASTPHEADPMVENATQVGVDSHQDPTNLALYVATPGEQNGRPRTR